MIITFANIRAKEACRPLYSSELTDCKLIVGTDDNQKEYSLHTQILCLHSDFFKAAFVGERFAEGQTKELKLPEMEPHVVESVLEWLYRKPIEISWHDPSMVLMDNLLQIIEAVNYMQINGMKPDLEISITGFLYKYYSGSDRARVVHRNDKQTTVEILDLFARCSRYGLHIADDCIAYCMVHWLRISDGQDIFDWISTTSPDQISTFLPQLSQILLKLRFMGPLGKEFPKATAFDAEFLQKSSAGEALRTQKIEQHGRTSLQVLRGRRL